MGRLAGPSPVWDEKVRKIRKESELRRRALAAITPIAHPPASRRQMALLWYIAAEAGGALTVGRRGHPPLTDDMRALVMRKYLVLKREPVYDRLKLPLRNCLVVTDKGAAAVARGKINDADRNYVRMAFRTGVVR